MYLKHLSDIRRTTSFRIGLLFLAVFGAAAAALIAFLYWQTAGYLARDVDAALDLQVNRWVQLSPDALLQEVGRRTARDAAQRQPAGIFAPSGEKLAGAVDKLNLVTRYDVPFDMRLVGPDGDRPFRAIARVLDSGRVLVVAQDIYAMREFDELLMRAIGWSAALIFPAGLLGAMALGMMATRRLDATTRAIERIVEGRLEERLPLRGNDDDLDRLAAVVNKMLDEIERLLGEVKGVADDVAHDLRTPLTRMLAVLEHAESHALTREAYAEVVAQTGAQARQLLRMFQALLHISDIENRVPQADLATVSLSRIAQDAFELFEPAGDDKQVSMHIETAGSDECTVKGHSDLLFNAISNLLDNAVKFTPPGGAVTLKVSASEGEVKLSVSDTGPGIPQDERQAVLRRFYRSERSRHTQGNGLGLSLVLAITKLHGFRLEIGDAHPGCLVTIHAKCARV